MKQLMPGKGYQVDQINFHIIHNDIDFLHKLKFILGHLFLNKKKRVNAE